MPDFPYVKPFRFWCQKVIPLVYDDALSYYEVLCKVTTKLNEVITSYNNIQVDLEEQLNELAGDLRNQMAQYDAKLAQLQNNVNIQIETLEDRVDAQLDAQETWVENQLANFKESFTPEIKALIEEKLAEVEAQLGQLQTILTTNNYALKLWVQNEIAKLWKEIPEITTVMVTSPVTSKIVTIQQALDEMYGALRYFCLTAGEYAGLQLTAEQYAKEHLMAWQYSLYSRYIFFKWLYAHKMHSTTTGNWTKINHAIYQLADHVRKGAYTANTYDSIQFTAQEYDQNDWTAYYYDWEDADPTGPIEWKKEIFNNNNSSLEMEFSNEAHMIRPTHTVVLSTNDWTLNGTGVNQTATWSVAFQGSLLNIKPNKVFNSPYIKVLSANTYYDATMQIRYNSEGELTTFVIVIFLDGNGVGEEDIFFDPQFICFDWEE